MAKETELCTCSPLTKKLGSKWLEGGTAVPKGDLWAVHLQVPCHSCGQVVGFFLG